MQLVDRPHFAPGQCAVTLRDDVESGPYVDTLLTPAFVDPRIYVSRQAVIDMGRLFGFPTPDEVESLRGKVERFERQVIGLMEQLDEADRYAEAAEYTLKATFGDDTKIRNKPGRKPKVPA